MDNPYCKKKKFTNLELKKEEELFSLEQVDDNAVYCAA